MKPEIEDHDDFYSMDTGKEIFMIYKDGSMTGV